MNAAKKIDAVWMTSRWSGVATECSRQPCLTVQLMGDASSGPAMTTPFKLGLTGAAAIEAVERQLFTRAYELAHGNQAKAARWLNVSRQTMRRS